MRAIYSSIIFNSNSSVMFASNIAIQGGAMYASFSFSSTFWIPPHEQTFSRLHLVEVPVSVPNFISYNDHSTVKFANNTAISTGGALVICSDFAITSAFFTDCSAVIFFNNAAKQGGAVYFKSSTQLAVHLDPTDVDAMIQNSTNAIFQDSTNVTYIQNEAIEGGAIS